MRRTMNALAVLAAMSIGTAAQAAYVFVCQEPGGKRLIQVDGNDVGPVDGKIALTIDSDGFINSRDGKRLLLVSDDDVRPTDGGLKLATFDGDDIRHGAGGKVVLNYREKEICPDSSSNRIYSIEGDEKLTKGQLIAAMYLLKPELFKLTAAEEAEQKKDRADAAAEQAKADSADLAAGTWGVLNNSGIAEKLGSGTITIGAKLGDAYPVTLDFTAAGGPTWGGIGHLKEISGDKFLHVAYGTPKTVGLCVYEINGGALTGTWYPWFNDGTPKNTGTENLSGPASLDGTYKITKAAAPGTGAAYTGTVTIKPADIVGAADNAKPYHVIWTFGKTQLHGMGIRTGKYLFVVSGTGADACIAQYKINNGVMTSDWFKVGSTEKGASAADKKQ